MGAIAGVNWIPIILTTLGIGALVIIPIWQWFRERDRRLKFEGAAKVTAEVVAEAERQRTEILRTGLQRPGTKGELEALLQAAEKEARDRGLK